MYGRLGGNGQPPTVIMPICILVGSYALMAIGHVLPVPANTTWDPDVLKLPISSVLSQEAFGGRISAAACRREARERQQESNVECADQ